MFAHFSRQKNQYLKGQIFPFLIAILCVVIIMIMITVNLGQIGIFKTDVSIAADSGALAGASVLSATLLQLGLQSDSMYGYMIVTAIAVILCLTNPELIATAIAMAIAFFIKCLTQWVQALGTGILAWSNAKRTAMQYAFQNAGVDEPRPGFKQFLKGVYGLTDTAINNLSASQVSSYYDIYLKGDDPSATTTVRKLIQQYTQNGFSRFMSYTKLRSDGGKGFWPGPKIEPKKASPYQLVSGYGWGQDSSGNLINSYDNTDDYMDFANYVEVEVMGMSRYLLDLYSPLNVIMEKIKTTLNSMIDTAFRLVWFLAAVLNAIIEIVFTIVEFIFQFLAGGIQFSGDNVAAQTSNWPLTVIVRRYKKETNLGLWNFRYGAVKAQSQAVAFPETSDHNIKPTCTINNLFRQIVYGEDRSCNTSLHLFETKLIFAQ